jgi:hypothetical protein
MTSSLRVGFCVLDFPQSPQIFCFHKRNLHKNSHLALGKIGFFHCSKIEVLKISQLYTLVIFVSVSLVRENLR